MKTSKKILLSTAVIVIIVLVIGLTMLRNDVKALINKAESTYTEVPVTEFSALEFSANWQVNIKQGREFKVRLSAGNANNRYPVVENINKTMYFKTSADNEQARTGSFHVKITAPSLDAIRAKGDTQITIENFTADSLHVILEDSVTFLGKDNSFKHTSVKTSGKALLEFINTTGN